MSGRIRYIDSIKGSTILLVVLGHVIQYMYAPTTFDQNIAFRYIYSFHMPLFFLLSGMFVKITPPHSHTEILNSIKRKAVQLLLPFLLWGIINYFILQCDYPLYSLFLGPDNGLWFIWVLFFIWLLAYLSLCLLKPLKEISLFTILLFDFVLILLSSNILNGSFGIGLALKFFPFYAIGILIGKFKQQIPTIKKILFVSIISGVMFLFSAYFWFRFPSKVPQSFPSWVITYNDSELVHFFIALLGIVFVISLFVVLDKHIQIRLLYKIGTITLPIYAIHQTIILLIVNLSSTTLTEFYSTLPGCIICYVIVILATFLLAETLKRNKYTGLLLGINIR